MAGANAGYATLSLIPSLKGAEAAIAGQLGGVSKSTEAAGVAAGGTFGSGFASKLAVVGPVAAAAVVVGLAKIGGSFDEQFDKIRVGTGATGKALDGLEGSFKKVLKTTATDFDSAGTAIANLNTRLGLTGRPLESLAKQFLDLSRITKTDLALNVDNLTRVFGDWEIKTDDQSAALDKVYRAAQSSGIGLDNLSSSVVQFGAPLRNLGFSFDQSLALLAQFNKTGVNTETVFAGLKKGVGTLAKAGEDVPATFKRIVDEITKLGPGTEATKLSIELFGQRAGPDLADAIAGGKFAIGDMLSAISNGKDTITTASDATADWGEKWQIIKNNVLVGIEPLATRVFDAVGKGTNVLADVASAFGEKGLAGAVDVLKDKFDDLGPVAKGVVVALGVVGGAATVAAAAAVAGALVSGAAWVGMQLKAVASTAVTVVQFGIQVAQWVALGVAATAHAAVVVAAWVAQEVKMLGSVALSVVQFGIQIGQWVALAVAATANALIVAAAWLISIGPILLVGAAVVGLVVLVVKNWDTIKAATGAVKDFVVDKFNALVGFVTGLPGRVASAASGMFDGIKNAFKSALNYIIRGWNGLKFTVPGFHVGPVGYDGFTLGLPQIPQLARGGDFGGLAVVGEAGTELVSGRGHVSSNRDLRSMIHDAIASAPAAARELIRIDHADFRDEVDLDILFARAQFAALAGTFG